MAPCVERKKGVDDGNAETVDVRPIVRNVSLRRAAVQKGRLLQASRRGDPNDPSVRSSLMLLFFGRVAEPKIETLERARPPQAA